MSRRVHTVWAILTSLMIALTGCRPQQPYYLHESGDLSHYVGVATDIEYPDVKTTTLAEVEQSVPPLTLENLSFASYWDLTLEEAIKNSLSNSRAMKSLGGRYVSSAFNNRAQTGEAPDAIVTAPDTTRTVYDPAIIETTPFSGVEYALSNFDAQVSTNIFYQKNDHQQNVLPQFPITNFFRQVFQEDTSTMNNQITKISAQGGQFTLSNNIVYDFNNNPTLQVAKSWNVNYQASFNQPLLAGAGTEFNRIAGPYNPFTNVPGGALQSPAFDGVMLARINVDISMADFEGGVRNLVSDTENAYWELCFSWRNLETSNTALESARQTWRKIHALWREGSKGGSAAELAQAQAQFFQFKSQTQTLLNELFRAENRVRYVMGLAVTDGRLIRPADKPTVAKVNFDWRDITEEALARSLDLRRQKWRIKQQELSIIAAKNLLMPRLDVNGLYRWLGLGDDLFAGSHQFTPTDPLSLTGSGALSTLASGQFQEWQLGVQGTMSVGFRKELATVRFYELSLARERAKLQDEELEVSHQLADAVRQLELNYNLTQTNFNRALAADKQVEAVQAAYEAGTITLDQLLEAQRLRADAQTSYFRTLLDYQRGIVMVHFRKGSLLEYNNVYLQEGPWPAKAKFDAHRLARQRDASMYLNYGFTRPSVVSQGAVKQTGVDRTRHSQDAAETSPKDGVPKEASPEDLPTPQSEMLPTAADESAPGADRMSDDESRPAGRENSEHQPGYEWGSLGLEHQSGYEWGSLGLETPKAAPSERSGARPRAVVQRKSVGGDALIRQVTHESKSTAADGPVENQPSGATAGTAAGGDGP